MQDHLTEDQPFIEMPVEDRNVMLEKMWIFTHGLASLICEGLIEDESQGFIINILDEVGTAVIGAALAAQRTGEEQA